MPVTRTHRSNGEVATSVVFGDVFAGSSHGVTVTALNVVRSTECVTAVNAEQSSIRMRHEPPSKVRVSDAPTAPNVRPQCWFTDSSAAASASASMASFVCD